MSVCKNDLQELREVYTTAKNMRMDSFKFKGAFLDIGYAKYLIKYLEEL